MVKNNKKLYHALISACQAIIKFIWKYIKKLWHLAENDKYKKFAAHFGVISGLLTIIGLAYGLLSYYQTVKPLIDLDKLESQVDELTSQKSIITSEILKLREELSYTKEELDDNKEQKFELESKLASLETNYNELQSETYNVYADKIMFDIIRPIIDDEISGKKIDMKLTVLDELDKNKTSASTENELYIISLLEEFVKENIKSDSTTNDLIRYIFFISPRINK